MSTPMIYQGRNDAGFLKDEIHIATGLQLLRDVAIDTHFITQELQAHVFDKFRAAARAGLYGKETTGLSLFITQANRAAARRYHPARKPRKRGHDLPY